MTDRMTESRSASRRHRRSVPPARRCLRIPETGPGATWYRPDRGRARRLRTPRSPRGPYRPKHWRPRLSSGPKRRTPGRYRPAFGCLPGSAGHSRPRSSSATPCQGRIIRPLRHPRVVGRHSCDLVRVAEVSTGPSDPDPRHLGRCGVGVLLGDCLKGCATRRGPTSPRRCRTAGSPAPIEAAVMGSRVVMIRCCTGRAFAHPPCELPGLFAHVGFALCRAFLTLSSARRPAAKKTGEATHGHDDN